MGAGVWRTFGEKLLAIFRQKLACIRTKKTIAFCQAAINHGRPVNQEELRQYLDKEMTQYQKELDGMVRDYEAARKIVTITELELLEIRKIYRRLAKLLHPDINPDTEKVQVLRDLWERTCIAYRCNQLDALQELEILASVALKNNGGKELLPDIPKLEEKIAKVEEEIERILSTDPYRYKYLLSDPEAVAEKNKALAEEYDSYEAYGRQLEEVLGSLMGGGFGFVWHMN